MYFQGQYSMEMLSINQSAGVSTSRCSDEHFYLCFCSRSPPGYSQRQSEFSRGLLQCHFDVRL